MLTLGSIGVSLCLIKFITARIMPSLIDIYCLVIHGQGQASVLVNLSSLTQQQDKLCEIDNRKS